MNARISLAIVGVVLAALVILGSMSLFTVSQTQQALVLNFGDPVRIIREPGLQVMKPWQHVERFDNRMLDMEPPAEEIIASDQKRLVVDTYARYRIVDPLKFFQTAVSENGARARLTSIISGSMRRVIGSVKLEQVLSEQRPRIMRQIRDEVRDQARNFGIEVLDVRIRRADLPDENSQAVYERMKSERQREAAEFRAEGAQRAQEIRSGAERERTLILAEAQKNAQILRGKGDADSIKIFAESLGKDTAFFSFYRSLQAYRETLGNHDTTMVLSPDSEFFRYLGSANGHPAKP